MLGDRREHARLNLWAEVRAFGPAGSREGQLRNLSRHGACFVLPSSVASIGEHAGLFFPRLEGPTVPLEGRVVRHEALSEGIEVAIEFDRSDDSVEPLVLGLLELLLRFPDGGARRHPRVTRRVAIHCRALHELRAVLEDVSAGGVRLTAPRALAEGDEIEISLPDTGGTPLLLLNGRVVRCERCKIDGLIFYNTGVAFGPLLPEAKRCLHELLRAVLALLEE